LPIVLARLEGSGADGTISKSSRTPVDVPQEDPQGDRRGQGQAGQVWSRPRLQADHSDGLQDQGHRQREGDPGHRRPPEEHLACTGASCRSRSTTSTTRRRRTSTVDEPSQKCTGTRTDWAHAVRRAPHERSIRPQAGVEDGLGDIGGQAHPEPATSTAVTRQLGEE
jgi:hypothetical protein